MSRCELIRAVLVGESPDAGLSEGHIAQCASCRDLADELLAIDALSRDLPDPPTPPELIASTWDQLEQALSEPTAPLSQPAAPPRRSSRAIHWLYTISGLAMAALCLLLVIPAQDTPRQPSQLIERGSGDRLPQLALKVAIEAEGQLERLGHRTSYLPGDILYFRAQVDLPAHLSLLRLDHQGASLVHSQEMGAGESDLMRKGAPLAWQLEPNESDAIFALVATSAPHDATKMAKSMSEAYDESDPDSLCQHALVLSASCEAVTVRMSP